MFSLVFIIQNAELVYSTAIHLCLIEPTRMAADTRKSLFYGV